MGKISNAKREKFARQARLSVLAPYGGHWGKAEMDSAAQHYLSTGEINSDFHYYFLNRVAQAESVNQKYGQTAGLVNYS